MKLHKDLPRRQCAAVVTPGEYVIDRWDGQQCHETNPMMLAWCEECEKFFCLIMHWHKHSCGRKFSDTNPD